MSAALRPPPGHRRRAVLLLQVMRTLCHIEVRARRENLPSLCRRFGLSFAGFDPPDDEVRPLPFDLRERWWAVECALRWWPFARERPCLRRSLVLGHALRALSPTLCLKVVALDPFQAHAWLVVYGQHLDMGPASKEMTSVITVTP